MLLNVKVEPKKITEGCFKFGNIENNYDANSLYFLKDGKPFAPISGEYHFSRYDAREWKTELLKMKTSGLNAVATYIFWNYHEKEKGIFDFSGNNDIKAFLQICREIDMPCIVRMGPWAHGECVWGGFPKYVQNMCAKRCDNKTYLAAVETFWTKLYEQMKEYCDGKTVLGIQLENEYTGSISHIHTLKTLAEKIGFKTPFFSMTAWPTNTPDVEILPTFGGYPEAPWAGHKFKLSPKGRFAICEGRSEVEIGEDLNKIPRKKISFDNFPYAGCEVGVGNQVTQMRRPNINSNDSYGIAFSKFASGMNWMGYYMYHGGRNPISAKGGNKGLFQESRITMYPNNYPIIDYDFQSPLSKDGQSRESLHRLRLMHTFISKWDANLVTKQTYFSVERPKGFDDRDVPYCSVRCDEKLSGYAFFSNYERGRESRDLENVSIVILNSSDNGKKLVLPNVTVEEGAMFFYPFNFEMGGKNINYVLAQPITHVGGIYYFVECKGVEPSISCDGIVEKLPLSREITDTTSLRKCKGTKVGNANVVVLPSEIALKFYDINGDLFISEGNVFADGKKVVAQITSDKNLQGAELKQIATVKLPYNYYMYSKGKRKFYELTIDKNLLALDNVKLCFDFVGLNLQVFSGDTLIDDYFNTDGKYYLFTKTFKDILLKNGGKFTIKTAAATKFGVGRVYNEIGISSGQIELKLNAAYAINSEII